MHRVYRDLPPVPRAILFGELLNHFFQVWIAGPKTPREPVSATRSNPLAVGYNVELAGLAWCADHVNVQALLDQGHETRDLGTVVLSSWTVNDFDLHVAPIVLGTETNFSGYRVYRDPARVFFQLTLKTA